LEILGCYADFENERNCSTHNILNPAIAINRTKEHHMNCIHIDEFEKNTPEVEELCNKADIIILERNLFGNKLIAELMWRLRNKTIITIFDDAYSLIAKDNVSYPFWHDALITVKNEKGELSQAKWIPTPLDQLSLGLSLSAGLQTVSQHLADDWRHLTDTYVIPNHLMIENYMNIEPLYKLKNKILVGWSGSLSHLKSWRESGCLDAIKRICRKYPQVHILTAGDKRVYDEIPVPQDRKTFQPFVPAEQYSALVKSFDIYLVPLNGEYDKRRSDVKIKECSILKVPWIATDYPTYASVREYGTVTENGSRNWEAAISNAIDNLPQLREKASDVAYPYALTQSMDLHVQDRIDLYQHIIEKGYMREQMPERSVVPFPLPPLTKSPVTFL